MTKTTLALCILAVSCLTGFRTPISAPQYLEMADQYAHDGENSLALDYYSKAIGIEPGNPLHYTTRGFFLLKQKRFDEALQDFSTRIRLEPVAPDGYLVRGLVFRDLKKGKEADADFREACRLGSNDGCRFAGNN